MKLKNLTIMFILLSFIAYGNEDSLASTKEKSSVQILKKEQYKKIILTKWLEPEILSNKKWIEYSEDYSEKLIIQFEENYISSEILVEIGTDEELVKKNIRKNIYKILEMTTNSASSTVAIDEKSSIEKHWIKKDYLIGDVFGVNPINIGYLSKKLVDDNKTTYKTSKNPAEVVATIKIMFPKNKLGKKETKYRKTIDKHASNFNIPPGLVYAITKVESHFNPMARSHVPAYGLMQIVPSSSGKDITKKLEGKRRTLSPKELYNGHKNIYYGTAYLNILYHSYLKDIKDEKTKIYCTIAAYNTGVGNVSKAFTGHTNIHSAAKIINSMTSEEVYEKLIKDLPYSETRYYLKHVRSFLYDYY